MANSLQTAVEKKTFTDFINSPVAKQKIAEMMSGERGDIFKTNLITAVANNPELAKCDNITILSGALIAQSLNLSIAKSMGQCFLIPYKDNKNERMVANFQMGYKGYIQLAIRTGAYRKINAIAIKEGELKAFNPLTEELLINIIEDFEERDKTPTTGYIATFELTNGFTKTLYWSKKQMEAHAKRYSKAYATDLNKGWNMSFWTKDFDEMGCKTMLIQIISKWGAMSTELQKAFAADTEPEQPEMEDLVPPPKPAEKVVVEPDKTIDQKADDFIKD